MVTLLNKLRTFVTVAEMKGFSRGAQALNLTQPAVTKQISSLEAMYNAALFKRSGRQVTLTEAGEVLHHHAKHLLEAESHLESAMRSFSQKKRQELLVGASTVPAQYILPNIVGPFLSSHPGLRITIVVGDSQEIAAKLMAGKIDLAIIGCGLTEPGVVDEELFDDEIVLTVPYTHRLAGKTEVALEDLEGEPFIWREKGSATRKALEEALGNRLSRLDQVIEIGATDSTRTAVEAGAGLAFLSRWAAISGEQGKTLHVLRLRNAPVTRKFHGCYLKAREDLEPLGDFLGYLREMGDTLTPETLRGGA